MSDKKRSDFVVDGRERVRRDEKHRIRAEVRARYAEAMARSSFLGRLRLRFAMWKEVRRELDRLAPPDGLYARR